MKTFFQGRIINNISIKYPQGISEEACQRLKDFAASVIYDFQDDIVVDEDYLKDYDVFKLSKTQLDIERDITNGLKKALEDELDRDFFSFAISFYVKVENEIIVVDYKLE